ncbi:beta-lactamase family protein [bacterium]|nr:beta-lactamase family protein [bacterium]
MLLFITISVNATEDSEIVEKTKNKLQKIANDVIQKDKQYRNCMITVSSGDGTFKWSSAVGQANQENNVKVTIDTPFYLASITKLFTAVVIMQLYEENKIDLEDLMVDYLPDSLINGIHVYKGIDYTDNIQIRHLLSHTSGIPDYYEKAPKGEKSFFELLLVEPNREWTVESTIEIARDKLSPDFAPGEKAQYSDTNFQLLGLIIEKVAEKPLHDIYMDYIFKPLEMNHSYLFTRSAPLDQQTLLPAHIYYKNADITMHKAFESSWADGGIISTMDDCIVFLKALNEGKLLKDKANLSIMHNWNKIQFPLQYGLGTMYYKLPRIMTPFSSVPGIWGHSGSTGSFLYYCEDLDFYMVGSINQAKSPGKPYQLMTKILSVVKRL